MEGKYLKENLLTGLKRYVFGNAPLLSQFSRLNLR